MKKALSLILALCMTVPMLCSCGSKTTPAGSTTGPGVEETSIKDEIVFAQGSDLTTMDPHKGPQERAYSLTNNIYDPLLTMDENMQIQPCLAMSWEWLENDCVLEMKLREGVKFQNGEDFTAEDAVFNVERLQELQSVFGSNFVKAEAPDEYTLRITLSAPKPALLNALTDPMCSMIPKDYYESDPDKFAANPIGTGPYMMKDYNVGDYYTLERFDGYWGGPAKTKYLTMRIIPESGQRITLLQTGEIDVAYDIPYNSVSTLKQSEDLQLLQTPSMKVIMLYADCKDDQPWANPTVRKAIEAAIDKDAIVQAVCYGYGTPTYSLMPPNATDYMELTGKSQKSPPLQNGVPHTRGKSSDLLPLYVPSLSFHLLKYFTPSSGLNMVAIPVLGFPLTKSFSLVSYRTICPLEFLYPNTFFPSAALCARSSALLAYCSLVISGYWTLWSCDPLQ
jgi:peptide/nickel transport system substrate-binding protein